MSIAAMAYRQLPAPLQANYTEILKAHRDYAMWAAEYRALTVRLPLGEYLFMRASVWPDEIRRSGSVYDHPTWHYTNFPVKPFDFPVEETLTPENDVLFAIEENQRRLADTSALGVDRAAALSWLLHVIGDIHQPLHCVALVSASYPEGDRGGNDFFVRPAADRESINLHAFWDGLLGRSGDVREARNQATLLWEALAESQLAELDPEAMPREWALEGRSFAISHVYLEGALNGAKRDDRDKALVIPEDYAKRAKTLSERRAVVAGYRIALVLGHLRTTKNG